MMILRMKKFLVTIQVQKPQTPYSLTPKILKKRKRGKKENQDIHREDIFEKAKYVTIISESANSSDLSYHQSFSTSLLDLFKLGRIQGDGNCLFRALCKLAFGEDSFHLVVRQTVCDYMIHNRDRFEQYMEEDTTIDQYFSKMLLNGEWGGHAEIVAVFWDIRCSNTSVWFISRTTTYS